MSVMLDTEGASIPEDGYGPLFDLSMYDWDDNKGPMLTINIPTFFEHNGAEYDSAGVLSTPLISVLEEYLNEFASEGGSIKSLPKFIAYLQDYAGRLERYYIEQCYAEAKKRAIGKLA